MLLLDTDPLKYNRIGKMIEDKKIGLNGLLDKQIKVKTDPQEI